MDYELEFYDESTNGQPGTATVRAKDKDGNVVGSARGKFDSGNDLRAAARKIAGETDGDPDEVRDVLTRKWHEHVTRLLKGLEGKQDVPPPEAKPRPEDESARRLREMPAGVIADAQEMLADPGLMRIVTDDIAELGVAGEQEITATIYLAGSSRLLARPLSLRLHGPSASGKSFLAEQTSRLFPSETVIHATQMTPQALFHMKPGSLAHRLVVAGERSRIEDDERAEATRALREMISAGRLTKLMPMKVAGGLIETVRIEQEGPISYVETTTLAKVFDEDENRSVALHTDEREDQTRRIVTRAAEGYATPAGTGAEAIIQRHHALQRLLQPAPVVIPYAERVAELFATDRVEARRAYPQMMSMIQAVCLLHQYQRDKHESGYLVAKPEDYQTARWLLAKPMLRLLGGALSDPSERFRDRLRGWALGEFTVALARRHERGSERAIRGWLAELHDAGAVELVAEQRGRQPATWKLASEQPDVAAQAGLPEVAEVFG